MADTMTKEKEAEREAMAEASAEADMIALKYFKEKSEEKDNLLVERGRIIVALWKEYRLVFERAVIAEAELKRLRNKDRYADIPWRED